MTHTDKLAAEETIRQVIARADAETVEVIRGLLDRMVKAEQRVKDLENEIELYDTRRELNWGLLKDAEQRAKELEQQCDAAIANQECSEKRVKNLEAELKNFLAAFDGYFEMRGVPLANPEKAHDAKQAMFSAAMQAREILACSASEGAK